METDLHRIEELCDRYELVSLRRMALTWPLLQLKQWQYRLELIVLPIWGGVTPQWTLEPRPPWGDGDRDGYWMPDIFLSTIHRQLRAARALKECETVQVCAAWVMNWHHTHHVRLGMTPREALIERVAPVRMMQAVEHTTGHLLRMH